MIVSGAESRIGTQYTIDTLRVLKARFPGVKFVWIMGADSLATFHRWRGWTQIMAEFPRGRGLPPLDLAQEPILAGGPPLRPRPRAGQQRPGSCPTWSRRPGSS